jgi:hypothetical protein
VKAFDRAIKLSGNSAWSYYGRAQAYRRLGKADEAGRDLAAAREREARIDEQVRQAGFDVEEPPAVTPKATATAGS